MTDRRAIDILGIGCVAVDDVLYVPAYPPPDSKARITRRERRVGGLTATALIAAARLGARCAFASPLGTDELSTFALRELSSSGIDVSMLRADAAGGPCYSVIVVDESRQTRNVFSDHRAFVAAQGSALDANIVRECGVLFVDHVAPQRQIATAQAARESGVPVVGDVERDDADAFEQLFPLIDHLIVSAAFALRRTGETDPRFAAQKLLQPGCKTVVVTCGSDGSYAADGSAPQARHSPAFPVNAVDTTGCGDVFHGAYAYALLRGMLLDERIRLASAAAALKATRPGTAGIPTLNEVQQFLAAVPQRVGGQ